MNTDKAVRDISPGAVEYAASQVTNTLNYMRAHITHEPERAQNYLELVIARAWLNGARAALEAAGEVVRE